MPALHLLQICLVYINTLMIQRVLTEPDWTQRMLPEDLRALTPLIYSHSLRDFSARYESEAGDRTRCGCCMTATCSATLPLVTRMFLLGLGSSVATSDPVQDRRRVVFRAVLPDEVAAVEQHGAHSGQGPAQHIGIFRGYDRIMGAPNTQNRGANTGERGAQARKIDRIGAHVGHRLDETPAKRRGGSPGRHDAPDAVGPSY